MLIKAKLFLFVFLLTFSCSIGQSSIFELSGYSKYLFSSIQPSSTNENLTEHLLHSRLNTKIYPTDFLTFTMEIRGRAIYGETVEKIPDYSDQIKSKHDFADLDFTAWNRNNSIGYFEVDRLNLDYQYENLQLTIGRQRIALGTSWVWNITDLFNPLSILDFDYEKRPGVDAIRVQYYTGAVSKIEAAFKPGKEKNKTIAAVHVGMNKWNYDFHLIGGIRRNRWIVGGAWAGDFFDAGFRGEIICAAPPVEADPLSIKIPPILGESFFDNKKPIVSFVLSGDYTFSNSFYIHTEILFNSNGKTKNADLYQLEAAEIGMLSPSRWSLFQEFSYNITPLIRGSIFGLFNPVDKSLVVVPSINWSMIENLDFMLIGLLFEGKPLTEFGDYGKMFFLRTKFSF
ncbi:MAG: hypothetical protein KJ666_03265 [Bacteroidetes bacterium]|nr:hypothetical protein [Bacteroidota bacterium]